MLWSRKADDLILKVQCFNWPVSYLAQKSAPKIATCDVASHKDARKRFQWWSNESDVSLRIRDRSRSSSKFRSCWRGTKSLLSPGLVWQGCAVRVADNDFHFDWSRKHSRGMLFCDSCDARTVSISYKVIIRITLDRISPSKTLSSIDN